MAENVGDSKEKWERWGPRGEWICTEYWDQACATAGGKKWTRAHVKRRVVCGEMTPAR